MKTGKTNILIQNFLDAAKRYADNIAIEKGHKRITYSALLKAGSAYAASLSSDASPLAGILADKSSTAYSGILGILLASKGYVPLNPKFPVDRTIEMLNVSGLKSVIVGSEVEDYLEKMLEHPGLESMHFILEGKEKTSQLSAAFPGHTFTALASAGKTQLPEINCGENDLAYLLFTSGSSGKPKAVGINNLNVTSYLHRIMNDFDFRPEDRFSHTFDLTFDLSVHDMFVCWLSGACLVIPETGSPFKYASYIREKNISVWFSVPSVIIMLDKIRKLQEGSFPLLRLCFFCGEALLLTSALKWQAAAPDSMVINLYGPAEATIAISRYLFSETKPNKEINGIVSIGKIFEGQHFLIIDDQLHEREKGELCLGGSQVINRYFNDTQNNSKSFFIKHNRYWYKTGDIVQKDEEGKLFFLGRADDEVKISGYRVNLHEIEKVAADLVKDEHVAAIYKSAVEKASGKLVLFVRKKVEQDFSPAEIIEHCRQKLPWYMLPGQVIFIDEFPLNENGKTDRSKLKNEYL